MAFNWLLPVRGIQLLVALIVLGLDASLISLWQNGFNFDGVHFYGGVSVSQFNYLIFVTIWTLLVTTYLLVATWRFSDSGLAHPFLVFGLEALSWIFWLAGWAAFAAIIGDDYYCASGVPGCSRIEACVAFGVIEWLLFCATAGYEGYRAFSEMRGGRMSKRSAQSPGPAV